MGRAMVLLAPQHVDPDDNYTLSREGISHFCRTGCEFTALDRFEREFYLYQRILLVRCVLAVADEVCAWVGGRGGGVGEYGSSIGDPLLWRCARSRYMCRRDSHIADFAPAKPPLFFLVVACHCLLPCRHGAPHGATAALLPQVPPVESVHRVEAQHPVASHATGWGSPAPGPVPGQSPPAVRAAEAAALGGPASLRNPFSDNLNNGTAKKIGFSKKVVIKIPSSKP